MVLWLTAGLGETLSSHVSRQISAAFSAPSIEKYLGARVNVEPAECSSAATSVLKKMRAIENQLARDAANMPIKSGQNPYQAFRDSSVLANVSFAIGAQVEQIRSKINAKYGAAILEKNEVAPRSVKILSANIHKLENDGRLPKSVDTAPWPAAFATSYSSQCASIFSEAFGPTRARIKREISLISQLGGRVANSNWEPSGFTKIANLIAYKNSPNGTCAGYNSCAIFLLEAPVQCKALVTITFMDEYGSVEDTESKEFLVSRAFVPVRAEVTDPVGTSAGTYKIKVQSCK